MDLPKFELPEKYSPDNIEIISNMLEEMMQYELNKSLKGTLRRKAIDKEIKSSEVLNGWKKSKVGYNKTPVYKRYQYDYRNFKGNDLELLCKEIEAFGVDLPFEQVLFRGALSKNIEFDWGRPISTTLSPLIAAYHAYKFIEVDPKSEVTIMAVILPKERVVRGLIGPFGDKLEFGHEYEVLVNFICEPNVVSKINLGPACVVVYQL